MRTRTEIRSSLRTTPWRRALLAALVALAACSGDDGGTTTPQVTPTIGVSASPATLALAQGQSGTSTVTLTRGGSYAGAVALAVTGAPAGVTVAPSPASLSGTTLTSTVTVAAAASTAPGSYNLTVTGSGTGVTSATTTIALTVNAAAPTTQTLTVATAGTGSGTVTSSPAGITCPGTCAAPFATGATVTLTATPAAGSTFAGWSGGCTNATGTCAATLAAATSVTATFNAAPAGSFTMALNPAALTAQPGGAAATSTLTVTRANGFAGAVDLAVTGAPNGLTVTPSPVGIGAAATTSTIGVTAAATTTPGTYPITITGTGAGIAQPVATTLSVTVAAVAQSFALSLSPASVSVQQGATATVTANVARGGGFAGAVSLAASGAPNGVTIAPNPASVTGASATLTVGAATTAAPGTYTITVTGTGTGVAQQTATFSVVVTQATGGGGGNVTYSFAGCDASQIPIWFAAQNGTGPWQRVAAGANNAFSFTVGASGGVAYVTQGTTRVGGQPTAAYTLTVFYASGTELAGTTNRCASTATVPLGTKTLTGTVAGVTTTDVASVSIGGAIAMVIPSIGTLNFALSNVPDGPRDLVASRSAIAGTGTTLNKLIIRRNVNYPNSSAIPTLDFNGAEAFDPVRQTITLNNLGADQAFTTVSFVTANGAGAGFYSNTATGATIPYFGVPTAQLAPTDFHQLIVGATPPGNAPTSFRFVYSFFHAPTDRTVTLGPTLSTTTLTSLATAPYLRLRAQLPSQSAYNGIAQATYAQSARTANVTATAAYSGGAPATWTIDVPDLTSAGFDPTWGLRTGVPLNWTVSAFGGDFLAFAGATPTDGAQIVGANATGSSSAFVQYLRSRGIVLPRP